MELEWIIKLNQATGQVQISGPIDNLVITLGTLEMAKMVIVQRAATRIPRLVAVNGKLPAAT